MYNICWDLGVVTHKGVERGPQHDHRCGEQNAGDEVLRPPPDVPHEGDGGDVAHGEADLQQHREHVLVQRHVRLLEDVD